MRQLGTLLIVIAALAASTAAYGRRQHTGPSRRLHVEPTVAVTTDTSAVCATDTIVPEPGQVTLSGYDKTAWATRESFFATNALPDSLDIIELELELDYSDMSGRQLHRATHRVRCHIPPGGTRQLTIPAWDRQHSFYYYRSAAPRRQHPATPYSVKSRLISVVTTRSE